MKERKEGRRGERRERRKEEWGRAANRSTLTVIHAALEGDHGSVIMVDTFVVTAIYCQTLPGAMSCS